jgi:hypothetical protein
MTAQTFIRTRAEMANLGRYFNRKWRENEHMLEIRVQQFEDEAGNMHPGLVGTMDGEVKQFTMNQFRADSETYHDIKQMLEIHASGYWGKTPVEIQAARNG